MIADPTATPEPTVGSSSDSYMCGCFAFDSCSPFCSEPEDTKSTSELSADAATAESSVEMTTADHNDSVDGDAATAGSKKRKRMGLRRKIRSLSFGSKSSKASKAATPV